MGCSLPMVVPAHSPEVRTRKPLTSRGLEEVLPCHTMLSARRCTTTRGSSMQGIEVRIARLRAGLKQYELAQRAGIREPELSMIETGRKEPSPEKAARITEALE